MDYNRIAMSKPEITGRAMMSILNSLSGYTPEVKLLAVNAVCEAINDVAQTMMGMTRHDLCTVLENMNKQHESRTLIAKQTIERMITEC